jgi:radical SAM family uncharacterized protein/radical SAM-linked protein
MSEHGAGLSDGQLLQVRNPAQYIGSEFNAVHKPPAPGQVRFAMCYPDLYTVGMSHVGSQILYHVLNSHPDACCERAFLPDMDAVAALRDTGGRLCTLESGTPLSDLDVVGITLQHELTYTTVLALLELGGIALLAEERDDSAPLVLGGGPCAYNPEPVAPFFDAFAIGDGEEVILEIARALQGCLNAPRRERLQALAQVAGVYVPAVHDPARDRITRRVVRDLETAPHPARPVVPFVEVVHDRAQVELVRGCTRGCRFSQAGVVYRPVRERSPQTVRRLARETIAHTGYDEISVVSLNCPDYTAIETLLDGLHADLAEQRVSIGLPSLRIDTFSVGLAQKVQRVRKSGLTFAPEAGSQRLRDVINKGVTEEDLLAAARAAFAAGWHTLKLYFMLGLPTETDEDLLAIAELVRAVTRVARDVMGSRAGRLRINVSVSTLVPKAFTPFQWDGQIPRAEILRRQGHLRSAIRDRQVSISCHEAEGSVVEAALARGGRQTGQAILNAFRAGAILDAWSEHFSYLRWERAFADAGLDLEAEATRSFDPAQRLPWEHIDAGVSREFLLSERQRALQEAALTPDCRHGECLGCGMKRLVGADGCPVCVNAPTGSTPAAPVEEAPVHSGAPVRPYVMLRFARRGPVRYLGHLDEARAMDRALRRSGLPVAYSEGFNPRAKLAFGPPLPVGAESEAELCALELTHPVALDEVLRRLRPELPPGLELLTAVAGHRGRRSPLADLQWAEWELTLGGVRADDVARAVSELLDADEVVVNRRTKSGEGPCNIRRGIARLTVDAQEPPTVQMALRLGPGDSAKPAEVVAALKERLEGGAQLTVERLKRTALY